MAEAIGIRLENEFLRKIEALGREEVLDRSATIRKLVYLGYKTMMKKKSAEAYIKGKITLSEAATRAELTMWEMEQYLVENGYKSQYSIDDLNKELKLIKNQELRRK